MLNDKRELSNIRVITVVERLETSIGRIEFSTLSQGSNMSEFSLGLREALL